MESPYGIVSVWTQGDVIIKGIAITLLIMSIISWWVIFMRAWGLLKLRRPARGLHDFWHVQNFADGLRTLGEDRLNPFRHLAEEGQAAIDHHTNHKDDLHGHLPLAEWLTACLRGSIDESAERLQRGLAILASVGSTAPFVGLFGTVWGIYHALVNIGSGGQYSLDKVAGPVGEALIMTAFGLAVAIPAVLGYNALTRANKGVLNKLNRFAHQLHAYFITGSPIQTQKFSVTKLSPRKEV